MRRAKARHSATSRSPRPSPRACGSTSSSRSRATESPTRACRTRSPGPAVQFGDPGRLPRVAAFREVGDDPGSQRLVAAVPAVLLCVQRRVPLHHPAEVPGPGRAEHERGGQAPPLRDLPDGSHRLDQPLLLGLGELAQQCADLLGRALVQHAEAPAGHGQRDDPAARVGRGTLPGDQAVGLEPGEDPAQVSGVDVYQAAQRADLVHGTVLGQLEQHPGLGERVRRAQVPAAEQADQVGVDPVELTHGPDSPVAHGPGDRWSSGGGPCAGRPGDGI